MTARATASCAPAKTLRRSTTRPCPANKTARTEAFKRLIALLNQENALRRRPRRVRRQGRSVRNFGPAIGVPVAGMPFVHDPSTVVRFHGKYYVFSTGRGAPFYSSPDTVTWTREGSVFTQIPDAVHAAVPKNNGTDVWAPDIIRMNNQFYLYYAVSSWGSFQSAIGLATNPVLDPKDPAYKWTDRGVVVTSNGTEDLNAIDPGVILAPDGTLWICYGSYHGSIRITQLDPKTGLALAPNTLGAPIATARESEASDIIFHDGFFYLFVNHGSCCKGRTARTTSASAARAPSPARILDRDGKPMSEGGGTLFLASDAQRIGPGHFGRVVDYDAKSAGDYRDHRSAPSASASTTRPTCRATDAPCWTSAPYRGAPTAGPSQAIIQPQPPILTEPWGSWRDAQHKLILSHLIAHFAMSGIRATNLRPSHSPVIECTRLERCD